jgi:hypothetical protein
MCSKQYNFEGFVGNFRELMIQFVQLKQSLGFDYTTDAEILKRFSKFTMKFTIKNHALTKEIVDAWTEKRPTEREATRKNRINNLRQFAKFLSELGYDVHIPVRRAKINRESYVAKILNLIPSPTNTWCFPLFICCCMDAGSGFLKR